MKLISPEPKQYLFNNEIVLFNVLGVGLLSLNKSPPNSKKST